MRINNLFKLTFLLVAFKASATNYVYNNGGVTTPLTMTGTDTLTVQAGTLTYSSTGLGTVLNDSSATNLQVTVDSGASLTRSLASGTGNIGVVALSNTASSTITNQGTISSTVSLPASFIDSSNIYMNGANTLTLINNGTMSSNVTSTTGTAGAHVIRANISPSSLNYTANITNNGTMSTIANGVTASTPTAIDLGTGRLQSGFITNTGSITGTAAGTGAGAPILIRISAFVDNVFNIDNQGTIELINNNSASASTGQVISSTLFDITVTNSGSITATAAAGAIKPLALSGVISSYTQTGSGSLTGNVNITSPDASFIHNSTGNVNGNITYLNGCVLEINNTGGINGNLTGGNNNSILRIGNGTITPNFTLNGTITDYTQIEVIKGIFNSGGSISSLSFDLDLKANSSGTINIANDITLNGPSLTTSGSGNINFTAGTVSVQNFNNNGVANISSTASLVLNGDLNNTSTFNIAGGNVVANNLNNSGTIYTSTPTSFSFTGSTFTNTGTLRLVFNDENNFSTMQATSATINSGSGTVQVDWGGGSGANLPSGEYVLIQGANATTASVGTFIQPSISSSYIQSMLASVSGNNVILTVVRKGDSSSLVGTTDLSANMANFLNQVSANNPTSAQTQLINNLQDITEQSQLNNSLDSLTPVISGPMQTLTIQQQVQYFIFNRMYKTQTHNYYSAGDEGITYGVWLRPFFEDGKQNNNDSLLGYKFHTIGIIGGFDKEISSYATLGIAVSAANTVVKSINFVNNSTNINTYLGNIYGSFKLTRTIFLDWLGSFGNNYYTGKRLIDVPTTYTLAQSDYMGQQYAARAILRKDFLYKQIIITPQISANYIYLNQHAYSETNAGSLGYTINSYHPSVFSVGAGIDFNSPYKNKLHRVLPTAKTLVYYDIKAATQNVTAAFITGGPTFVTSATPGRWTGQLGLGLVYKFSNKFNIDINYDLFVKTKYYNNIAYLNFNYNF